MKPPKDYAMAEAGYNAFYQQQPQVWFADLAHEYQMKWVRAAREMMRIHDGYRHKKATVRVHSGGKPKLDPDERHRRKLAYQADWRKRKKMEREGGK